MLRIWPGFDLSVHSPAPQLHFTFDGFLIPSDTRMRGCLWEPHRTGKLPGPVFRARSFLTRSYTIEQFAPFGLAKKRCIGVDLVLQLSARAVERMVREYDWEIVGGGPPYRSVYHWHRRRASRFARRGGVQDP